MNESSGRCCASFFVIGGWLHPIGGQLKRDCQLGPGFFCSEDQGLAGLFAFGLGGFAIGLVPRQQQFA